MENVNGNKNRNTRGVFLIAAGLLLIAAALTLVLYNLWDAKRAERASGEIAEELERMIRDEKSGTSEGADKDIAKAWEYGGLNGEMPEKEIDGYPYIGILEIPGLSLRLPVMAEWNYERLKISPCRYSGSYYSNDMVICAHNYEKHFGSVRWIDIGADVYFTTVKGYVYHYQVSNRETIQGTAAENMTDRTKEDWDMTLFTCNTSGQTRCAVRCVRV